MGTRGGRPRGELRPGQARRSQPRGPATIGVGRECDSPSLRRLSVTTPHVLAALPKALGARPGSRYLLTTPSQKGGQEAVALDRGEDLGNWRRLRWVGHASEAPVTVVLEGEAVIAAGTSPGLVAEAERLSARAAGWARSSGEVPIDEVVLDPLLARHVGRASGVLDAHVLGLPGALAGYRPQYNDAARLSAVQGAAHTIGPRSFTRRTGLPLKAAERAALGKRVSGRNVERALWALRTVAGSGACCALEDCDHPVPRAGARYCSCHDHPSHQDLAKKRRKRARTRAANGTDPDKTKERTMSDLTPSASERAELVVTGRGSRRASCGRRPKGWPSRQTTPARTP